MKRGKINSIKEANFKYRVQKLSFEDNNSVEKVKVDLISTHVPKGNKSYAALNMKSGAFAKRPGSQAFKSRTRDEAKLVVDTNANRRFYNNESGRYNSNFNVITKKSAQDTKLGKYASRKEFIQKNGDTSEI